MKILFCDNIAGIAGDMFAASFVDAGLISEEQLKSIPQKLGIPEARLTFKKVKKANIVSTHLEVDLGGLHKNDDHSGHAGKGHHLTYREITDQLKQADLSPETRDISLSIYKLLAESEANVHDTSLENVHFHEVGNPDSLIDVVMAGTILANVQFDRVCSTPVKLGKGTVNIQHGTYPVPPPATAFLAQGFPVEAVPGAVKKKNVELSTPTGLAILKFLDPEFHQGWAEGTLLGHGYGAGSMDLGNYPNLFRIAVFEREEDADLPYQKGKVVEISCNIDDQTAEKTGWCMEKLLEMGALDVWLTPIHMKKNRLAVCLSVLAKTDQWKLLADWMLRNTSTFGIRYKVWDKLSLDRDFEKRRTDGNAEITYKVGKTIDGEVLKTKPEYEEAKHLWEKD